MKCGFGVFMFEFGYGEFFAKTFDVFAEFFDVVV